MADLDIAAIRARTEAAKLGMEHLEHMRWQTVVLCDALEGAQARIAELGELELRALRSLEAATIRIAELEAAVQRIDDSSYGIWGLKDIARAALEKKP